MVLLSLLAPFFRVLAFDNVNFYGLVNGVVISGLYLFFLMFCKDGKVTFV